MAKQNSPKIPPHNLDAEMSLLGAILIDEEVLSDVTDKIRADDFYEKRHSIVFGGMMRLFERHRPIDLLTLSDELEKKDELEMVGGSSYLS